jgi:hypothetical protein
VCERVSERECRDGDGDRDGDRDRDRERDRDRDREKEGLRAYREEAGRIEE